MTRSLPIWAVVPVKSLDQAKRRLAPILSSEERRGLVRAMLEDVLGALDRVPALDGVLVVTVDPEVRDQARLLGAEPLDESGSGLNAALSQASARLVSELRVATVAVIPADVPLLTPADLEAVLASHGETPAVTVVPDRQREGTNGLVVSPPGLIGYRFGVGSAEAHLAAGRAAGAVTRSLELPRLGLDVDVPQDLLALLARPSTTATQAWLAAHRIGERLAIPTAVPPVGRGRAC